MLSTRTWLLSDVTVILEAPRRCFLGVFLSTSRDELASLERDYQSWIRAFLGLDPGRPAASVDRIKNSLAIELGVAKKDVPAQHIPSPDTVKKWASRCSIPAEPIVRDALVRTIEEAVINPPKELNKKQNFSAVMTQLVRMRAQSLHWDLGSDEDLDLYSTGALKFPVQTAKDLDPSTLGLGSFLLGGKAPPFVNRSVQQEIFEFLDNNMDGVLVIEGPPKSGKTRLLVEVISRSESVRQRKTYWISSLDGSVGSFLKAVARRPGRNRIIVLDDLQQFRPSLHSEDFNLENLRKLSKYGLVVVTKHSPPRFGSGSLDILDQIGVEGNERGEFANTLISRTGVKLEAQLDETELVSAMETLAGLVNQDEASSLAAFLSSGQELLKKFLRTREEDLLGEAIFDAVVDCHILQRQGFTIENLRVFARARLEVASPGAAWSDLVFEQRFLALTLGVTPQSPHAILNRQNDTSTFRLFDYIWDELRLSDWSLPRDLDVSLNLNESAMNAADLGFFAIADSLARKRLEEAPKDDLALAIHADLRLRNSDFISATKYAELAIDINPHDWRYYRILSQSHRFAGRAAESLEILQTGLNRLPECFDLLVDLGNRLVDNGKGEEFLPIVTEFPLEGYPSKLNYYLAVSAAQGEAGRYQEAILTSLEGLQYFEGDCGLTVNWSKALSLSGGQILR